MLVNPIRGAVVGQAIAKCMTLVTVVGIRDYINNTVGSIPLAGGAEHMAGDTIVKSAPCLYIGGAMYHLGYLPVCGYGQQCLPLKK